MVSVGADGRLHVHFMGWAPKWDLHYERSSPKLKPHHSQVPNWRIFRANDKFDMKVEGKWHQGSVEKVDRVNKKVLLRPIVATVRREFGEVWYEYMRYAQRVTVLCYRSFLYFFTAHASNELRRLQYATPTSLSSLSRVALVPHSLQAVAPLRHKGYLCALGGDCRSKHGDCTTLSRVRRSGQMQCTMHVCFYIVCLACPAATKSPRRTRTSRSQCPPWRRITHAATLAAPWRLLAWSACTTSATRAS